jgi:hypothetical protein
MAVADNPPGVGCVAAAPTSIRLTARRVCDACKQRQKENSVNQHRTGTTLRDPSIEFHPLRASVSSTSRTMCGLKLAQPCSSISTLRKCLSFHLPCGATIPRSSRIARNWLIRPSAH